MSIYGCGYNYFNQLGPNSNNKNHDNLACIHPPIEIHGATSFTICLASYYSHSILISNVNQMRAIGDNREGLISGSLPREIFDKYITFEIKDDKNRLLVPQSAVCGAFYTLYLVKNPEDSNKYQLAYPLRNSEQQFPEILKTGDSNPIAIYGGFRDAAAIDNEGRILFIPKEILESSNNTIVAKELPDNEKAACIAFGYMKIFCLSKSGKVFISSTENDLDFNEVPELHGIKIIDISGSSHSCLALTSDGKVYGFGSNDSAQLGLGRLKKEAKKFTEITSLKKYHIRFISAGVDHSLFIDYEHQLFACGSNAYGQLPIDEKIGEKKKVYTPVKSNFDNISADYAIAGSFISCIFDTVDLSSMSNTSTERVYR